MFLIRTLNFVTVLVLIMTQSHFVGDPELGPPTWLVIGRFALLLTYCLAGAVGIFLGIPLRRLSGSDIPFIFFLALAFISMEFSIDPSLTFSRSVSATLLYGATFWTVWSWARRYGEKVIIDPLVAAGGIVFIAGLMLIPLSAEAWQEDGRFRGCLANPNTLGLLASVFSPLLLWRYLQHRRWHDLALLAVVWVSLILAATRNGLIASFVGTAFMLYFGASKKWFLLIGMAGLAVISFLLVNAEALEGTALGRLAPTSDVGSAGRTDMWDLGWILVQQRPITGHGFGTEDLAFGEAASREYEGHLFHNSYLGMVFQLGYLGVLMFFGPLLYLLITQVFRQRHADTLMLHHALLGVLIAGLISSFFESWIYSVGNAISFPFWVCIALLVKASVDDGEAVFESVSEFQPAANVALSQEA